MSWSQWTLPVRKATKLKHAQRHYSLRLDWRSVYIIVLHNSLDRERRRYLLAYGLGLYVMGQGDAAEETHRIPLAQEGASFEPEAAQFAEAFIEAAAANAEEALSSFDDSDEAAI